MCAMCGRTAESGQSCENSREKQLLSLPVCVQRVRFLASSCAAGHGAEEEDSPAWSNLQHMHNILTLTAVVWKQKQGETEQTTEPLIDEY